MGIQPIDLQTIYTQMEKIGRQQGAEQQASAAAREHLQDAGRLEAEKNLRSVREVVKNEKDGVIVNKDGGSSNKNSFKQSSAKEKSEKDNEEEELPNYIKDPHLGIKIDISG